MISQMLYRFFVIMWESWRCSELKGFHTLVLWSWLEKKEGKQKMTWHRSTQHPIHVNPTLNIRSVSWVHALNLCQLINSWVKQLMTSWFHWINIHCAIIINGQSCGHHFHWKGCKLVWLFYITTWWSSSMAELLLLISINPCFLNQLDTMSNSPLIVSHWQGGYPL